MLGAASAMVVERSSDAPVMVWIEDAKGAIARARAESVTKQGVRVQLTEAPGFAASDVVALRISFAPGAPTVATTARVSSVRAAAGAIECSLEWTASATERAALEPWLAA
jgi:hypothetical protein